MLIVVQLCFVIIVFGLDCYQCNSTLDSNCQDRFNHDETINPIRSTPCTVYNARYCIKITGVWGGKGLELFRGVGFIGDGTLLFRLKCLKIFQ